MNVKAIFADCIYSWDTRADGSATVSRAALYISEAGDLCLRCDLRFDEYDADGGSTRQRVESADECVVMTLDDCLDPPEDLPGWLAAAHDEVGLLRLDVDGETIYEYEPVDPVERLG